MNYLDNYLELIKHSSSSLSESVATTSLAVWEKIESLFDYRSHLTGLLIGNVQSGKTAQVLGILSKLADKDFEIFIILTSDNVLLQRQTTERAKSSLATFNVYSETEDVAFLSGGIAKPTAIVLKKNSNVLRKWRNLFSSSGYCQGRPIVIIDDEADAASLNTLVNRNKVSTINSHLAELKILASSSLYIQVTATPQSIVLQSNISGWKPSFIHYFEPGKDYIGGSFIYSQPKSFCVEFTDENELDSLKNDDVFIAEGLRKSLCSFLVVCAHSFLNKIDTCNFLVHPSVRIVDHQDFSRALGEHLNLLLLCASDELGKESIISELKDQWVNLQKTKPDIQNFEDICDIVISLLEQEKINVIILNSTTPFDIDYNIGYNIIVGGNSLGRGVTFPKLQTVYYCRKSKTPQADTFWQHSRIFGYDRDKGLIRIFLPPSLFNLFSELNVSNRLLIDQILNSKSDSIQLIYPDGVKPTRSNVLDKRALNLITGGVNFFSSNPRQDNEYVIDKLIIDYDEKIDYHVVNSNKILELLQYLGDENNEDWDSNKFKNAVFALALKRPNTKYALIIRKGREISRGTGTLLSPTDRKIGYNLSDYVILTIYKVTGSIDKGWKGRPFYLPNIKLPSGTYIYDTIDI